jgi:hypothetical protein
MTPNVHSKLLVACLETLVRETRYFILAAACDSDDVISLRKHANVYLCCYCTTDEQDNYIANKRVNRKYQLLSIQRQLLAGREARRGDEGRLQSGAGTYG